jgi:hypothetical protein
LEYWSDVVIIEEKRRQKTEEGYRYLSSVLCLLSSIFCLLCAAPYASESDTLILELDKKEIQNWYYQGEFDKVIEHLESYRRSNPDISRDDSILVHKYLGVIYASDPEEKTKGEGYLYTLLKIEPLIDLTDMHISAELEELFEKIKQRYQKKHAPKTVPQRETKKDTVVIVSQSPQVQQTREEDKVEEKKKSLAWIWWSAGGAAVAVLATVTFLSLQEDAPETIEVPPFE